MSRPADQSLRLWNIRPHSFIYKGLLSLHISHKTAMWSGIGFHQLPNITIARSSLDHVLVYYAFEFLLSFKFSLFSLTTFSCSLSCDPCTITTKWWVLQLIRPELRINRPFIWELHPSTQRVHSWPSYTNCHNREGTHSDPKLPHHNHTNKIIIIILRKPHRRWHCTLHRSYLQFIQSRCLTDFS